MDNREKNAKGLPRIAPAQNDGSKGNPYSKENRRLGKGSKNSTPSIYPDKALHKSLWRDSPLCGCGWCASRGDYTVLAIRSIRSKEGKTEIKRQVSNGRIYPDAVFTKAAEDSKGFWNSDFFRRFISRFFK